MKLHYSPTSPFVRKVTLCAAARGIDGRIERVATNAQASQPDLLAHNPLSKVPCLVTEDGTALFDSPVICEYLDSVGSENPLLPPQGAARWRTLKIAAMGDGIMDAAVLARAELARPGDEPRLAVIARQKAAVERTLDALEADPPGHRLGYGAITVICALGYLDLRFAADDWRARRPKLAAWYASMCERPEVAATAPPG